MCWKFANLFNLLKYTLLVSARDYLERSIIISKGSVERAKVKLDRICTFRTLYPHFFGVRDMKKCESLKYL